MPDKSKKNSSSSSNSGLLTELMNREHAELAQIVVELVSSDPKLRPVLDQLLGKRLSNSELAKTKSAISSLLRRFERGTYSVSFARLRKDLEAYLGLASRLEKHQPYDAGRVYAAILESMLGVDENVYLADEEGHLSRIIQPCVENLRRLIWDAPSPYRMEWLLVLCDAYLYDLHMGGQDFAIGASDILLTATTEEWSNIEAKLDAVLQQASKPPRTATAFSSSRGTFQIQIPHVSSWAVTQITSLKAERIKRSLGEESAREFLLNNGTPQQRVGAHIAAGNFDTATSIAEQYFTGYPGLIRSFADALSQAGQWERAKAWAIAKDLMDWLPQQALAHKDPDAFEFSLALFRSKPSFQTWNTVFQCAPEAQHASLRENLWRELTKQKAYLLQFDLLMNEKAVSEAREIWPRLKLYEKGWRQESLARATESTHPAAALELWTELASEQIARRTRGAYRAAAEILGRIRKLYIKLGDNAGWEKHIQKLRTEHQTLRAFQEELKAANL